MNVFFLRVLILGCKYLFLKQIKFDILATSQFFSMNLSRHTGPFPAKFDTSSVPGGRNCHCLDISCDL